MVPAHSFKSTAVLQAAQAGDAPALIRIETKDGHGAGTPISKVVSEAADKLAFALHFTGADGAAPATSGGTAQRR